MIITKETKAVAQGVLNYFEKHPERHDQNSWFTIAVGDRRREDTNLLSEDNLCNTTMCIAGTAVFLTSGIEEFRTFQDDDNEWFDAGSTLLGLSYDEADWLFYSASDETAKQAVEAIAGGSQEEFDRIKRKSLTGTD